MLSTLKWVEWSIDKVILRIRCACATSRSTCKLKLVLLQGPGCRLPSGRARVLHSFIHLTGCFFSSSIPITCTLQLLPVVPFVHDFFSVAVQSLLTSLTGSTWFTSLFPQLTAFSSSPLEESISFLERTVKVLPRFLLDEERKKASVCLVFF